MTKSDEKSRSFYVYFYAHFSPLTLCEFIFYSLSEMFTNRLHNIISTNNIVNERRKKEMKKHAVHNVQKITSKNS